jgi:hypothetical protein
LQSTGIYIVHPKGTGLRRLTREGGFAGSPVWSADSRRVLYYETDEVGAYRAKSAGSRTEVVAMDIATGERTQLTAPNETKLSPQWLPDGKLSYVVRSLVPRGLKVWHPDRRVDTILNGAVRHLSWLPGTKQVAYERILHRAHTEHLEPTASRDPEFELVLSEPFPSFSPDGIKLLYSQYGMQGQNPSDTNIEIMNADDSGKQTLFHKEGASAFRCHVVSCRRYDRFQPGEILPRARLPGLAGGAHPAGRLRISRDRERTVPTMAFRAGRRTGTGSSTSAAGSS